MAASASDIELWKELIRRLDCGHPMTSCTPVSIVGLDLKVFGLEEIKESKKPLVVLVRFFLSFLPL